LLAEAKKRYDVVIVDTPAATLFPDAELISAAAGSAIMLARKGRTRQRRLHALAKSLSQSGVQLLGTVMSTH
jgi:protein-tyrosine kinase